MTSALEKKPVHKLDYFVNAYLRVSRAVQEVQAMKSEVRSHRTLTHPIKCLSIKASDT